MQMRLLSGSDRNPVLGARPVGAADPTERLEVSWILRSQPGTELRERAGRIVAGDADPQTGYDVRVDGYDAVIGGTSAVAPLSATLVARLNFASPTKMGFINSQLYKNHGVLNDITVGNNGDFVAATGWDACTGLGTPIGSRLAAAVTKSASR